MIKKFKEFLNEGVNQSSYTVISNFLKNMTGYTFSEPRQLNALAGFVFGTPVEPSETMDTADGIQYIFSDQDVTIRITTKAVGDKYKVTEATVDK